MSNVPVKVRAGVVEHIRTYGLVWTKFWKNHSRNAIGDDRFTKLKNIPPPFEGHSADMKLYEFGRIARLIHRGQKMKMRCVLGVICC